MYKQRNQRPPRDPNLSPISFPITLNEVFRTLNRKRKSNILLVHFRWCFTIQRLSHDVIYVNLSRCFLLQVVPLYPLKCQTIDGFRSLFARRDALGIL